METNFIIREYNVADKQEVIDLLRRNTPQYFAPEEEADLIYYLEKEIEYYYVIAVDNQIVGSGGFNFSGNPKIGKISWDILHPEFQGKSLGSALLHYRIEKLRTFAAVEKITVRTSQVAYRFYEKLGFKLVRVVDDYWADGFDLYEMEYSK